MNKYQFLASCAVTLSAIATPAMAQSWDEEVTGGSYDSGVYGGSAGGGSYQDPYGSGGYGGGYGGGEVNSGGSYGGSYDTPSGGAAGGYGGGYGGNSYGGAGGSYGGNSYGGAGGGYGGGGDDGVTVYPGAYGNTGQVTNSETRPVAVTPYIEFSQIGIAQLSPGDDVLTYSQVAAGIDTTVTGRNNGGSLSLRYERNFGWGDARDTSSLSGVARGYASVVPQTLTVEAGALATRTRVDASGASTPSTLVDGSSADGRIYSAYAGPNLQTRIGDAQLTSNYRFGYTRVETPDGFVAAPGAAPVDVFDDSMTHSANARIAVAPGEPLPIGIATGASYYQEDSSTLDQRVRDANVRTDITVPVTRNFAVLGGVGYEDVQVSSRDAIRDANGDPVLGADGQLQTNEASPRQIAYETSGLIWDVGVLWRPSPRTALEAHVGRRYDSTTYYGSFGWQPNDRSNLNISVYDAIQGFGGRLGDALAALPTNFDTARNPVTGQINGCVSGTDGSNCVNGVLGSVRSSVFRSRGVSGSYGMTMGRFTGTLGAGYDRRTFIAGEGTVLAAADGLSEESYWVSYNLGGRVGRNGGFDLAAYANWFDSDVNDAGAFGLGSSAAYSHNIAKGLSARAALAYDFLDSDVSAEDIANASALVGLRYNF